MSSSAAWCSVGHSHGTLDGCGELCVSLLLVVCFRVEFERFVVSLCVQFLYSGQVKKLSNTRM